MSETPDIRERGRSRSDRLAALLPGIVLAVAFGTLFILKPNTVRSSFGSGRALLVIGAIALGWIVLARWVLPRILHHPWARSAVLTTIALVLALVIVVPYFRDEKVVEEFPGGAAAGAAVTTTTTPPPSAGVAPTAPPTAPPTTAPAQPVVVSSGSLSGIDHSASGTARIYRQPNGTFVIGLEEIDVESGPDYFVHVVPGSGRENPDGGIDLGALRGNQGTQFYEVPSGSTVGPDWTVLIWCRAFGVPVANATQLAA